jgi:hypothetical protein
MADLERRLRDAMESAVATEQPPGNLIELVRRRHRRHVLRASVAGVASLAVVAILIPAGTRLIGRLPGPAGGQRPDTSAVYVEFQTGLTGTIVPISAATNRPGQPIHLAGSMTLSRDSKTLYVSPGAWTTPISTATNQPGQPIRLRYGLPGGIVIAP